MYININEVTVLLSLFSLCLIATAMSKMLLYIDAYGMTQKRVYVSLFMILMAVGFVFCVISQITRRVKMTWVCLALSALMLIVPAYANIDTVIASYNVERYMDGSLKHMDYSAIDNVAAMPALEKLYNSDAATEKDIAKIKDHARDVHNTFSNASVFSFNIPNYRAYKTAESILGK